MEQKKLAMILASCFLLVSCTTAGDQQGSEQNESLPVINRQEYSHIRAVLDTRKQTAETPLDKYVHSEDELTQIAAANFFNLKKCVNAKGYEVFHHFYQTKVLPEMPLGVWSEESASKNGTRVVEELGKIYIDEGIDNDSPAVLKAHTECQQEMMSSDIPGLRLGLDVSSSSAESTVLGETYNQAQVLLDSDSEVQSAIHEWKKCLEKEGVVFDAFYKTPVAPEEPEANIKQALLDVQCKTNVKLMEIYFNAQAQYEQALIEKNQAVFNRIATLKQEQLEEARKILRENGVTP